MKTRMFTEDGKPVMVDWEANVMPSVIRPKSIVVLKTPSLEKIIKKGKKV